MKSDAMRAHRTQVRTLFRDLEIFVAQAVSDHRAAAYPLIEYQRDPVRYVRERLHVKQMFPHQAAILEALAKGVAGEKHPRIAVRSGQKALALDTPIPTPSGWSTMGSLRDGDLVFDENGAPTRITQVSEIRSGRRCFDVEFDDGTVIIADADHEWITTTAAARRSMTRSKAPRFGPSKVTTEEIARTIASVSRGVNHAVEPCGGLQCARAELPIDPYVLGVWLGNGTSANGHATILDADCVAEVSHRGYECIFRCPAGKASTYKLVRRDGVPLARELRAIGQLGHKHVPPAYLRASEQQRADLLAGLLDTDGHATKFGTIEFTNTNIGIAESALELARSLGFKAQWAEGRATLNGVDYGPKYRITWTPHSRPFRVARKNARLCLRRPKPCAYRRAIVAVRPRESLPVRCIEVEAASHQFLCSRAMIPTCNSGKTATAVWAALWFFECFEGGQVLLTAAIEAQTRNVLWKELGDTLRRARAVGGTIDGEMSRSPATGLVSSDGSRSIRGVSGRDIEALAGISGRQLMIVDEASHLPEGKAQVFAGNQMGGGGAQLLISNPTANSGPFYEAFHTMAPWWQTFHVDCEAVADWQAANEVRIPFTTSREKIEEARAMYGEDSPFWAWRIKGDFLRNEVGRAMPMIRIEAAIARWAEAPADGDLSIGWDVAGDGIDADANCWVVRRGLKCLALERRRGLTEEQALAFSYSLLLLHRRPGETPRIMVDAEGPIGSAYYGRLRGEAEHRAIIDQANGFEVFGIRASSRFVRDKTKFDRVRDELIWTLSQWLKEGAIPNDAQLQAELYEPKWEPNANNKLVATPKSQLREKLGRSPDSLDALALSVRGPTIIVEDSGAPPPAPAIDVYSEAPDEVFDPYAGLDWQRAGRGKN